MKNLIILLIFFSFNCKAQLNSYYSQLTNANNPITVLFFGESNSGGKGENDSLTVTELSPRNINIFNNFTRIIEPLDVGTNNLLYHAGFTPNLYHGIENGIANLYDNDSTRSNNITLIKCGQGGTKYYNWTIADSLWATTNSWDSLVKRTNETKLLLDYNWNNKNFFVFFSFGINDAFTDTTIFRQGVETMIANLHNHLGFIPQWYVTRIDFYEAALGGNPGQDYSLQRLAAKYNFFNLIETNDLTFVDAAHWDFKGLKNISRRMVNQINTYLTQ